MCFSILDKCKHSDDENHLCVFAKNKPDNITTCKLIYPKFADNDDIDILPKCFDKMLLREKYSWSRKLDNVKSGIKPKK